MSNHVNTKNWFPVVDPDHHFLGLFHKDPDSVECVGRYWSIRPDLYLDSVRVSNFTVSATAPSYQIDFEKIRIGASRKRDNGHSHQATMWQVTRDTVKNLGELSRNHFRFAAEIWGEPRGPAFNPDYYSMTSRQERGWMQESAFDKW